MNIQSILSLTTPYDGTVQDEDYTDINQIHEQLQKTLNNFWKLQQNEYLVEFREHQCCDAKSNYKNEVYGEDVELLHNERKPRAQSSIGVIHKINSSKDNKFRDIIVRYKKNGTIFRISRPINKFYRTEYKKHKDEVIPKFIHERNIATNVQYNVRDFNFVFV